MNFRLPTFKSTPVNRVVACGEIMTKSPKSISFLKSEKRMVAKYFANKKECFLSLTLGGKDELMRHLHIECEYPNDISRREELRKRINADESDIKRYINKYYDLDLNVGMWSIYSLPIKKITESSFIKSLLEEKKMGSIGMVLTGGTLDISGAQIKKINWKMINKKEIEISLLAERKETLDDDYLIRINNWVNELFDTYILGNTINN